MSTSMLADRLQRLVEHGLVSRRPYGGYRRGPGSRRGPGTALLLDQLDPPEGSPRRA